MNIGGFRVPKGTMVIPLQWAIHMDPDRWSEPHRFDPHRFLSEEGKVVKPDCFMPFQTGNNNKYSFNSRTEEKCSQSELNAQGCESELTHWDRRKIWVGPGIESRPTVFESLRYLCREEYESIFISL